MSRHNLLMPFFLFSSLLWAAGPVGRSSFPLCILPVYELESLFLGFVSNIFAFYRSKKKKKKKLTDAFALTFLP